MANRIQTNSGMFIAMAGLPGTGKSTVARELDKRLHASVLSKDIIRAELFPGEAANFSQEQDDLCMEVIFIISKYLLRTQPGETIIIDGRTFSRSYQIEHLLAWAGPLNVKAVIIECVCDDAIARERLEKDERTGAHPAGNRTYDLYRGLKEKAEPIIVEHLIIDTGREPLEKSVERCLAYLSSQSA